MTYKAFHMRHRKYIKRGSLPQCEIRQILGRSLRYKSVPVHNIINEASVNSSSPPSEHLPDLDHLFGIELELSHGDHLATLRIGWSALQSHDFAGLPGGPRV